MTRAIKENDPGFQPKRTWSKGCHPRSCENQRDYETKLRYVKRHQHEGAVVHVWTNVIVTPNDFQYPKPTALPSDDYSLGDLITELPSFRVHPVS